MMSYHLLDIPSSLTPLSFTYLKPFSSNPPTQPRNPPEPKKKDIQWPQAEDLKKLHEMYGECVKQALQAAHEDGVKEWCQPRIQRSEEGSENDIRQWHELFKVMDSFGGNDERNTLLLSSEGFTSDSFPLT